MIRRSPDMEVDKTFDLETDVTKAWETASGQRMIRGVASGILEDADGERVSRRAIAKMAREAGTGLKLTTRHHEDWADEIGDVVKVEHDSDHDELLIEAELPVEGEDPLSDKAWKTMLRGEKLGFSIGGKCRKAFFELSETGKRRKVLDDIYLRHVALTKKPSYRPSFAEAVAKTASDLEPPEETVYFDSDEDFDKIDDDVAKDVPANRSADDQSGQDRNAGVKGKHTPSRDVDQDDEPDKDKPAATEDLPTSRHLACPNCGHEFAAELSAEEPPPANDTRSDRTSDRDERAAKSAAREETDMSQVDDTLEQLRQIADPESGTVEKKTDDEAKPAAAEEETAKTATSDDEVLKLVATSHRANADAIADLEGRTAEGLGEVVKAVNGLAKYVQGLPAGRRSVAKTSPGEAPRSREDVREDVEKTRTDGEGDVEKQIEEASSLKDALKLRNQADFGIPAGV